MLASAGLVYETLYGAICGRHPEVRPWHFQWLATKDLYRALHELLPQLRGRVLDVGCGSKPYRKWMTGIDEYIGLDASPESSADIVITAGEAWPLPDACFDVVFSTQVLEHVSDLDSVLGDIRRVLKPGGQALVSVPFIYNEHGTPDDFRRFSAFGAARMFPEGWEIQRVTPLGGIGSSLGILFLNWIELSLGRTRSGKLAKAVLLPAWIVLSGLVNAMGSLMDRLDHTAALYVNVLVLARKPRR